MLRNSNVSECGARDQARLADYFRPLSSPGFPGYSLRGALVAMAHPRNSSSSGQERQRDESGVVQASSASPPSPLPPSFMTFCMPHKQPYTQPANTLQMQGTFKISGTFVVAVCPKFLLLPAALLAGGVQQGKPASSLNNRGRLLIPTQLKKVLAFLHTQHRQTRDVQGSAAAWRHTESLALRRNLGDKERCLKKNGEKMGEERHCAPWTKMLLRSCIAKLLPYNGFRQDGM